ncbi:MAG TPA: peptidase T [Bacteroidales bacterium]|nr:peptidase T [Bacteroidales bacterium]
MDKLVNRFLRYVTINSGSDEMSETSPSTQGQTVLAGMLAEEMKEIGLQDISVDDNGYVMATLPSNVEMELPVIGFLAHLDTSPDCKSENIKPQLVEFLGENILLNKEENIFLSHKDFPVLNNYIGQTLVTTDGTTLLGADDKAGIAEIMAAMDYIVNHPEIKHGTIRIAFTPDEEIGRGADKFDVKKFNADFAYTIDGGELGEIEYENFNAARARLSIKGLNVHPGTAKNKMKNSMLIAMEINNMLPAWEVPEHTDGYEGFFHLTAMSGTVESTTLDYILRDHNLQLFNKKKELLISIVEFMNMKYGQQTVSINMSDQYYNMKEKIEPVFHIVELAKKAITETGIDSRIIPVRGGTDGSRLSYMGLPCPNLFTGGHNFHSRFEFIPVKSMEKAVEVIVKIIEMNTATRL